ncbi:MAG: DUF4159 domain-containing protein [bacterium]|nr:DUF4159 domain-containing protein [bacterium]
MKKIILSVLLLFAFPVLADIYNEYDFVFAVLKYGGGGDWYSILPAVKNLVSYVKKNTDLNIAPDQKTVSITDDDFFLYPFILVNGHENIRFTQEEAGRLKKYLTNGGFLFCNDDYGLFDAFKREIKKVFPDRDFVEVPFSHPVYHVKYDFPDGLPKVHEHFQGPSKGLGIFYENRLVVFYAYNSDIGDGWEKEEVYHDSLDKREASLKMGVNIIYYSLMY